MIVYDFEVFMFDWLVVFNDLTTNQKTVIVNDTNLFEKYYKEHKNNIFVGYNNKAFDDIIYRGILSGVEPYTTMTFLMNNENKYLAYKALGIKQVQLYSMDLMQDILGMSLKQAEGYMGLSVEECSVPFDLERKLYDTELQEVIKYCIHDVDATTELLKKRQDYVQSKLYLVKLFKLNLNDLSKTNAGLSARVLDATKKEYDDEMTYDLPKEIVINNPTYRNVLSIYTGEKLEYNKNMMMDVCGIPHSFAYGGLHAARDNFNYCGEMWNIDINSFYPSIIIEYGYMSRSTPLLELYIQIYHDRLEAKAAGDKNKADALKLVLNTVFGVLKSEFNALYDPKMSNQICITGQLLFLDLLDKLEPYITLVQTNTDGILVIPKNKEMVTKIVDEWCARTRMTVDIDVCDKIWQKDVNNYIMVVDKHGKMDIKVKGSYVAQYKDDPRRIRNVTKILDVAVVDYFVKGIPVEKTISECDDIFMFQYITKTGKMYDRTTWVTELNGNNTEVNNVNRVYASIDPNHGTLYKHKTVNGIGRQDKIGGLPDHCVVDNDNTLDISAIDKQWYITVAKNRINDYLDKSKKLDRE